MGKLREHPFGAGFAGLPGSQLIVSVGHLLVSFAERDKRVEPDLDILVLHIGERREWWLRGDKLKRVRPDAGSPFYVILLQKPIKML